MEEKQSLVKKLTQYNIDLYDEKFAIFKDRLKEKVSDEDIMDFAMAFLYDIYIYKKFIYLMNK